MGNPYRGYDVSFGAPGVNTDPNSTFFNPDGTDINRMHDFDDRDSGKNAHHHTLGVGAFQAAIGNHSHDGVDSAYAGPATFKQIIRPNLGDFNTIGFADWITGILIPAGATSKIPKWAQDGLATVDIFAHISARIITNPAQFNFRLVTFATNGNTFPGITITVAAANMPFEAGCFVAQTILIPKGTTQITTKIQASQIVGTGALRCSTASNGSVLIDATIHR